MEILCSCLNKDCHTKVRIEADGISSISLWLVDHPKAGEIDLMMYLDANGAVMLVKELQRAVGRLMRAETDT